ncbi:fimbria/pilus outer membrane usher protein [Sphingomonas sp. PAMC 26617]|uniref:fimbria/pilus outer membrane usher protein n=1 Tax=Sphingomonas sp. PAMC 26617 TaxID=1112216 RepID=UPI000289E704|nr:fimbria/pilus outer membrane usher protein [Sphingomonas sp. PAMC 26617]
MRAKALRSICECLLLIGLAGRAGAASAQTLLEVWVNGRPTGKIGEFVLRGDRLAATPRELAELGLSPRTASDEGLADIVPDRDFQWHVDQATGRLYVIATEWRLVRRTISAAPDPATALAVESGTGATLNYDMTVTGDARRQALSAFLDARVFSGHGVASGQALMIAVRTGTTTTYRTTRLDVSYTLSLPDRLLRLRLGDFITSGADSQRAVRLGGIQFGSDFALRPDLITMPLPDFRGNALVPTTADILVNDTYASSLPVGAGPFEIRNVPVQTGSGNVSLNLHNSLGQSVRTTVAYYASNALLAPGLHTFVLQLGAIRHRFGSQSNAYGQIAASGNYRWGVSPRLTAAVYAEATRRATLVGANVSANLADLAIATGDCAASSGRDGIGLRCVAQLEHRDALLSIRLSHGFATSAFRDIAASDNYPAIRQQTDASIALAMGRVGTVSLGYTALDPAGDGAWRSPKHAPATFGYGSAVRLLSVNYSIQRGSVSIYANASADTTARGGRSIMAGLSLPLGRRDQASVDAQMQGGRWQGQMQAARGTTEDETWGYQAAIGRGAVDSQFVEVQHRSRVGWLAAGIDRTNGSTTLRAQARGSLSAVDGSVFLSNTVNDSFAIVDTQGLAGVQVFHENRVAGRTGRSGKLMVPDLRSFQVNHLAIEPTDLPPDAVIATGQRDVRPQDRSGVVLRFPIKRPHGALLILVDARGEPVPPGSTVTLDSSGATFPLGLDGETFVEELDEHAILDVARPDGTRCRVGLSLAAQDRGLARLGPFVCIEIDR